VLKMVPLLRVSVRLERGFARLSREDQDQLRVWFRIPPSASPQQACRILARYAPPPLLRDIESLDECPSSAGRVVPSSGI